MRKLSGDRGFTLVEVIIVLAVSALLLPGLFSFISIFLRTPSQEMAEITAMHDIQQLNFWVSRDGNAAKSFSSGSVPDYGTFSGLELASGVTTEVDVRYFYQDHRVMREVTKNDVLFARHRVADNIEAYADVAFQFSPSSWSYDAFTRKWSYTDAKIVVAATATVPALDIPADPPDARFSATMEVELMPRTQRDVAVPGNPPEVPPLPNQLDFNVSGEPTILRGTYVSGNGANLKKDDALYYTVRAAGSPPALAWEVTSEPLPYTSITNISIQFIGQTDATDTTVGIYVYNPTDPTHIDAGYATVPDHEEAYYIKNVDYKSQFPLSDEDVSYVNSLPAKVVKLKITATRSGTFRLSGDMIVFRVAGTLEAGYVINYKVNTAEGPVIVTGTYQAGSGANLDQDDILYFQVSSANVSNVPTVTWTATSEVITSTISNIDIIWVGRVERVPTTQQFYIYNLPDHGGDGYDATPDYAATYTTANTDTPLTFSLSPSDVAYINASVPKQVIIKVKAVRDTGALSFTLTADQLLFRVTP